MLIETFLIIFLLGVLLIWVGQREKHYVLTLMALLLWLVMGLYMWGVSDPNRVVEMNTGEYVISTNYTSVNGTSVSSVDVVTPVKVQFPNYIYLLLQWLLILGSLSLTIFLFFL